MKYIRDRQDVSEAIKVELPHSFLFRLYGFVVEDLEKQARSVDFDPRVSEALLNDFTIVKQAIRSRDESQIAGLSKRLCTQSMLKSRMVHCSTDAQAFYICSQLSAFLKKYPFNGVDTKSPALDSFIRAEKACSLFNNENYRALERLDCTFHPIFGGCIDEIRTDIEELLGAFPPISRVEEDAVHGPGVSLGPLYKEGKSTSYYKWANLPYSVTKAALPLAKETILSDPRWIGALDYWYRARCGNLYAPIDTEDFWSRIFRVVDGSRITTVPKNGLTDRTIAIEPVLNVYLQLGVDKFLKRRLKKRWNYDLSSQEKNQRLAQLGALDGSYATLDLKAASDTISLKICEMLLPPAWYGLLLDLRSPKGVLEGLKGSFEKISSMGNGFTFALETLLFGAIVRHVMRRLVEPGETSVYGDDIVVPTRAADSVVDLLSCCGFTTNDEKSFISGPFRESCGTDWFLRYNVRPVFLKRQIKTVMDLYYIHNRLFAQEASLDWTWDCHFEKARAYIRKHIPKKFGNVYGPPSDLLDGYLFSDRKLPGVGDRRKRLTIVAKPLTFNKKSSFLFRKLMVSLKGTSHDDHHRWDKKKLMTSSNAFDITRRDSVQYICTKIVVWFSRR